ncbi:sodium:solute symporter family protein [bacterium]|nr:sodium:solute symporter family protein [bacterium]MBP9810084.1 sodium:solute symporter family protein [bacterium]
MKSSDDFLLAGHRIPSWVTGLAFLSANLGAIEVMGMAANAAQYGVMTCHFYWLGAIPAMVFLAVFMMPFYYKSKIRSVPEYLRKRFNEPTRALNAISFAVMTVLMSGINLYAMAIVFKLLLGWDMNASIAVAALVVLAYTITGGLTSSIYNEVLQFFLIVFGLLPVSILGLLRFGSWQNICDRFDNPGFAHLWKQVASGTNPMGVDMIGLIGGLGFVLSFGYWCTDFLVIQRALAAEDLRGARMTPIIAAFPKILFPVLTVLPGLFAIILIPKLGTNNDDLSFNMAIPYLLAVMYPNGLFGLGITALLASFMSGMAGNVTAFNTVWTYDIYQSYIAKNKSDAHYLWMGKLATAIGIIISVGTCYLCMNFKSIMDYMQLIFTFFNAPLFATFLLGMFFRRTSPWGAFYGLLSGTMAAVVHYVLTLQHKLNYQSDMAGNFHRSVVAWTVCLIVTITISYLTKPKAVEELRGLVWGVDAKDSGGAVKTSVFASPGFFGVILLALTAYLNYLFF